MDRRTRLGSGASFLGCRDWLPGGTTSRHQTTLPPAALRRVPVPLLAQTVNEKQASATLGGKFWNPIFKRPRFRRPRIAIPNLDE